jgi:sugar lactone lactonase YvrE
VVHQLRQRLDRADHHYRHRHHLHHRHRQPHPDSITAGPDGALWFTNYANNTIGRITTTGTVTNYSGPDIHRLSGITAGPDGALWFTNGKLSIGRITTSGTVTNYTGTSKVLGAEQITAGPDGALWFASPGGIAVGRTYSLAPDAGDSIGRMTTSVTPAITGFTPASGVAGATVTITGQNLSGAKAVAFDGTPATIVSHTAIQIVTEVPSGAATGPITVTTPVGTATSRTSFAVT